MLIDKLKLFVIWLNGYMEACGNQLNEEQTKTIKAKLDGLFEHVAEPVVVNPSLQELGELHGFPVIDGFPNQSHLGKDSEDGVTYRC